MSKLWHTKRAVSSVTATDNLSGYLPANVADEALAIEWRANGVGAKTITIVFTAQGYLEALFLHGVNFAAATVKTSTDNVNFSAGSAFASYADEFGRRRGLITLSAANVLAVRVEIAAGAATDGAAFWRIGAAYPMASVVNLPGGPEWGYGVNRVYAQVSRDLPSRQAAVAVTGIDYDEIAMTIKKRNSEDLSMLKQKTREATCIFTTDLSQHPAEIWPVRAIQDRYNRARSSLQQTDESLTLRERVANT